MDTKLTVVRPEPSYPDAKSQTSFQDGLEFQDFVCSQLARHGVILQNLSSKKYQFDIGENLQGFEIKLDSICTRSGRLSIEVAEKTRDDPGRPWTPSGILRGDNTWLYIQGNYEILFVFSRKTLAAWYNQRILPYAGLLAEKHGTIRTFYIDFGAAIRLAAKVIEF
jgi:hypothetical protein